jgi:hypothetical protein
MSQREFAILRKTEPANGPSAWRHVLVAVLLLTLVVQGYATQTHLHKQNGSTVSAGLKAGETPRHDNFPVNDDPANCPVCQQILHAGQFVAPAWLLPFLILAAVSTIEITTAVLPHYDTVSHSWRGRGPPLH